MVDGLGGVSWDGSLLFCYLFSTSAPAFFQRSVLELGAGTGICSLVCACKHSFHYIISQKYPFLTVTYITFLDEIDITAAASITATDRETNLIVENMNRNVARIPSCQKRLTVNDLEWAGGDEKG